jgi:hypothetical protein
MSVQLDDDHAKTLKNYSKVFNVEEGLYYGRNFIFSNIILVYR